MPSGIRSASFYDNAMSSLANVCAQSRFALDSGRNTAFCIVASTKRAVSVRVARLSVRLRMHLEGIGLETGRDVLASLLLIVGVCVVQRVEDLAW
jgi:hypothetical protein